MNQPTAQTMGRYLVTPMSRLTEAGLYQASVSIRRGMHDRVYRFVPRFRTDRRAMLYAMSQARALLGEAKAALAPTPCAAG
ncbi:MAG: hypothetical protein J0H69_09870 [Burkholderiales bacterium]|jgi:hypothetical protein|nr:hypothetical protein [Burkholderiales bacterium]